MDDELKRARDLLKISGDTNKRVRIRVNNLQKAVEEMLTYLEREHA